MRLLCLVLSVFATTVATTVAAVVYILLVPSNPVTGAGLVVVMFATAAVSDVLLRRLLCR